MLLLCAAALGQVPPDATSTPLDPEGAEDLAPAEPAPPPPPPEPALPSTFVEGFTWVEAGPRAVTGFSDVAVHPGRSDLWAVITAAGVVWVTLDGGHTWLEVLSANAAAAEGDRAGEVEARLREVGTDIDIPTESSYEDGGEVDAEELEQALQDAADEARDASEQAVDDLQGEIDGDDAWFLSDGRRIAVRPRVWFTSDGLLVVARADGLRVSGDLGGSWTLVLEEPVTSLAELPEGASTGGRFVVGTPDGLLVSPTLTRFSSLPGFDAVSVHDLVEDDGVYAATSDGLWFSADLFVWRHLTGWVDEVQSVRPIAAGTGDRAPRALVLGAEADLWRALDPVASPANSVFGGPVRGAAAVARRDEAGATPLLLAASATGPFESVDGGASWTRLPTGLPDGSETRDVEVRGSLVLLAATGGLYQLAPAPERPDAGDLQLEDWVPLPALVDAGTLRKELNSSVGRRWAAALVPQVTLDGTWNQEVGDDWDADTWTIHSVDTWWQVHCKLTWRPNRQTSSTGYFDAEELASGLDVLVIDGDVVLDDGITSDALVSKVNRGATVYRTEVADTITTLWSTRQRLVTERAILAGKEPLVDQIARALRVEEIEARLDALTNGAVSSWEAGNGGTR